MNDQPKVSVIMPSLNVVSYIRECIESVVNQTLKDIEIICVDAGSTDGTLEVLREYEKKDPRVTVILSEKKSYGHQMNLGIKAARGEYMGIVETDDFILPEMYEELYGIAVQNSLDMIKGSFCRFYGEPENRTFAYAPIAFKKTYYDRVIDPALDLSVFKCNMVTCPGIYNVSFLRENHISYNETPGASYQDNGFWFQTFMYAHKLMFCEKAYYMVRRDNPNSSVKSRDKVYCLCEEYDYIRELLRKEKEIEARLAPLCAYFRKGNYDWTITRLSPEYRKEFIARYSADFAKIEAAGELDRSLYTDAQWESLHRIINDPDAYWEDMVKTAQQGSASAPQPAPKPKSILHRIIRCCREHGFWYTVKYGFGRVMRKLCGGLRCCREHGLRYTLYRILVHLHLANEHSPNAPVSKTLLAGQAAPVKRDYAYYSQLPPEKYAEELKLWYKGATGEELDLENPRTFNEKIQWMKLYDSTPIKTRLADKYLVRDWVKEKIGAEYLIPLLGVWDSFDEIDFDKLPNQFALKANHGSGWNIIVKDKAQFNKAEAKEMFDKWMRTNFAFCAGFELHYMNIPPKIIAEQYMENIDQLYDYKVMCFDGKAAFIWLDTDRYTDHHRTGFDLKWNKLPVTLGPHETIEAFPKPKNLEKMISLAEELSKGFAHVRVDFYEVDNKLYFGEMTFTPATGSERYSPRSFEREVGDLLTLPPKSPIPERMF